MYVRTYVRMHACMDVRTRYVKVCTRYVQGMYKVCTRYVCMHAYMCIHAYLPTVHICKKNQKDIESLVLVGMAIENQSADVETSVSIDMFSIGG